MTALSRATVLSLTLLIPETVAAGDLRPSDWLLVAAGGLPIVVATPHGGREAIPGMEIRRGVGVPQFTVQRDNNTFELAELLAAGLASRLGARPYLIAARFERKQVDANRAESAAYESAQAKLFYDAYHAALAAAVGEVRRRWGAGLLLDLHGQGAVPDVLFRGTDNGRSVSALLRRFGSSSLTGAGSLFGQMTARGYKVEPAGEDREQRYTGGYTTRTYGSHREGGIDAIQLEFGTRMRAKAHLKRTADDLAAAIEAFSRFHLPSTPIEHSRKSAAQPQP